MNHGNTCFANSAVQAIRSCSEFTRELLALQPTISLVTQSHFHSSTTGANTDKTAAKPEEEKERNNRILIKLQFLLAKLVFSQRPALPARDFINQSRPSYFGVGAQQDCVEYIDYLFAVLNDTEKADQEKTKKSPSPAAEVFSSSSASPTNDRKDEDAAENQPETIDLSSTTVWRNFGVRVENHHVCHACGHRSVKEDAHTNLPLPLITEEQQQFLKRQMLQKARVVAAPPAPIPPERPPEILPHSPNVSGADMEGGRPAKVLCGEENGVKKRHQTSEGEEASLRTASPARTLTPIPSLQKTPFEIKSGQPEKDHLHPTDSGAGSKRRSVPLRFSPMTPASSPSSSPPTTSAALSSDVILEEDEEEEEREATKVSPLLGNDPYLTPLTIDVSDDGIDDDNDPPPFVSPFDNGNDIWESPTNFVTASASMTDASQDTPVDVDAQPPAEWDASHFDPHTLANKLEALHQSAGPARVERWVEPLREGEEKMEEDAGIAGGDGPSSHASHPSSLLSVLPISSSVAPPPVTSPANAAPNSSSAIDVEPPKPEAYHLRSLLRCYLNSEYLVGDNAYHCERCNEKRPATRQAFIKETSDYLILPLLRFEYNGGQRLKKNDPVEIPELLDVPVSFGVDTMNVDIPMMDAARASAAPTSPPPSPSLTSGEVAYRLLAVVVHASEKSDYGHYFTYVRTRPENNTVVAPAKTGWVLFNDAFAKEVSIPTMEELLRTRLREEEEEKKENETPGGQTGGRNTPYILFYERTKSNEDATRLDLRRVAPSLSQSLRQHISMDNLNWLNEKERTKGGGGADASKSTSPEPSQSGGSWKRPGGDDDDKKGGGPCGGAGFGSLGNGPRFVF